MLENLVVSSYSPDVRSIAGSSFLAAVVHACVITFAGYATMHAGPILRTVLEEHLVTMPRRDPPRSPPLTGGLGWRGTPVTHITQCLVAPILIPREVLPFVVPPVDGVVFDPAGLTGFGPAALPLLGTDSLRAPGQERPFAAGAVEEQPEVVPGSCRAPRYPEVLRQAGIEGRVALQFVIDTLGHAEPGSVWVLAATHGLFEVPARAAVLTCRFRPGRLQGRAVRVLVRQAVNFMMAP